jgi:hypothetical protein
MERKNTLTLSAVAGIILASGAVMQSAQAKDLSARSAMLNINIPCKNVTNNVCNIDQIFDSSTKSCKATIFPKGIIASERAFFRDRSDNKKLKSVLTYGFKLENSNSYNGTDVYGMKVQVTGNPGGKRFDVTRNENDGLLVELLEINKGVNLSSYNGANGAKGNLGILTSSDGQTYNKNCKQEVQGKKVGVAVNAIQNGAIGSCSSAALKDGSVSNNDAGADVVTWTSESITLPPGNYLVTASATLKNMYDDNDELMILASKPIHVNDNKTCDKVNPPIEDDVVENPEPVDFDVDPTLPPDLDSNDPFGNLNLTF